MTYVAQQVMVSVESLSVYLARAENRWEQFSPVMQHLGFRRPSATNQVVLIEWLSERALKNERPAGLLQLACERLYYLPLVQSGELLAEVDTWTKFSAQLTHAGGVSGQFPQLARYLYAIILAQALPSTEMSRSVIG